MELSQFPRWSELERTRRFCLMQLFRNMRLFLLALLVSVTAISSHAQFGVSINVGFAPPILPVYEQPICPQPNLMWTPGYWAYSPDYGDYYWVPGAWEIGRA